MSDHNPPGNRPEETGVSPGTSGPTSGSSIGGPDTMMAGRSTSGTPPPIIGDHATAVSRIAIPSTVAAGMAEALPGRAADPPSSK